MSTFQKPTRGTSRMEKNAEGRSPKVEACIDIAVDWIYQTIRRAEYFPMGVIDLGCDSGYMLHRFRTLQPTRPALFTLGVDMYSNGSLFPDVEIMREDVCSAVLPERIFQETEILESLEVEEGQLLVTMSHALEHVCNPHAAIQNIKALRPNYVYIAVPEANSEWANWGSHLTCWTEEFLRHTMVDTHGFEEISMVTRSLNPEGLKEVWGLFSFRESEAR